MDTLFPRRMRWSWRWWDGVEDDEWIGKSHQPFVNKKSMLFWDLINSWLIVEITVNILDILGLVHIILFEKLKLSKFSSCWVSKVLSPECNRQEQSYKWDQNPEDFLSWIGTWLYKYDLVDKAQSEQWLPQNGKCPAKVSQPGEKVIVTVSWEVEGILQLDVLEGEKQ